MLAAMGPKVQKYLWWKKYLTVFQILQFVAVLIHACQLFISNPCNVPLAAAWCNGLHSIMFLFLFWSFFKQTYKKENNIFEIIKTRDKTRDKIKISGFESIDKKEDKKFI